MEKNKIERKKEWCYENVLLHVPHSSMNFPEGTLHHFNDLDEDERLLIDYYTDELFVPDVPHIIDALAMIHVLIVLSVKWKMPSLCTLTFILWSQNEW